MPTCSDYKSIERVLTTLDVLSPSAGSSAAAELAMHLLAAEPDPLRICHPAQHHCAPSTPFQQHLIHADRHPRGPWVQGYLCAWTAYHGTEGARDQESGSES